MVLKLVEWKMAFRNLLASKRRTILTILIMAIGLGALFFLGGWINFIRVGYGEQLIREQYGHFQIYPVGHLDMKDTTQSDILFSQDEVAAIEDILYEFEEVDFVNPRIYYAGSINNSYDYESRVFFGYSGEVLFEEMMAPIDLVEGVFMDPSVHNPVVIGSGLAEAIGVTVGDEVTMQVGHDGGRIDANIGTISGIAKFEFTEVNNRQIISTLDMAYLLVEGSAQRLIVMLNDTEVLDEVLPRIDAKLQEAGLQYELVKWVDLADFYAKVLRFFNTQLRVLSVVILLMFAVVIINTLYMSIMERQAEIGTLRAIGISRMEIIRVILYEGVILGVVGFVVGIGLGYALQTFLVVVPLYQAPPPGMYSPVPINMILSPDVIIVYGALQMGISILSTLFPSFKAVRVNIVTAIRQIG